jgi:hypothetical protein
MGGLEKESSIMRKLLKLAVLLSVFSVLGFAQTSNADEGVASRDEVLKFMEVLRIRPSLVQYFEGVAKQAKLGAEEGFKQKVPNATPEQLAEVDKFAEGLFKNMPVDEMVDAMVPIYQKHLTKHDMDGILAFYASPVGQKLQREQPAMMQEGMQVGGEIGRKRLGDMMQQMDDFLTKMAQEQKKSPQP